MECFNVRSIMDKMENSDSDYRYMAASDLLSHLRESSEKVKLDTSIQQKVRFVKSVPF